MDHQELPVCFVSCDMREGPFLTNFMIRPSFNRVHKMNSALECDNAAKKKKEKKVSDFY